ncbi:MAG TPA: acyl-CoA carboxylase epsilon subunit [Mycobacteriales bacterium]|nr:acyl-CoA carboxylase epsilon subunit [Mycobacteriales bacterium]
MTASGEGQRPLLRVVGGGEPTDDELAALVAAVATVSAAADRSQHARSRWNDRRAQLRGPLDRGPGAWVAAARR